MVAMSRIISPHPEEEHKSHRAGWLRAAVLGADDGIVSTASLMIGVASARASDTAILTAGIAGLTAGALSMAVGEYVSVSSQKDSEHADIAIERRALKNHPEGELGELAHIYVHRGLAPDLAKKVAQQLHDHDALNAHVRDELGIYEQTMANPLQASLASAVSFSVGALVPVLAAVIAPQGKGSLIIVICALLALAISGGIGAFLGGGRRLRAASRVFVGGGVAMAITALIGHLVGTSL
jgi:VIT1/CCC1 family predicted Fe2+/Mn2+ transporter